MPPPLARRSISGALLLVAALSAVGVLAAAAAPRAVIDRPEIDLGDVVRGREIDARFEIRNVGEAPLSILEVESGCDCTVVEYDPSVGPGGRGSVTVRLLTRDLSGPVGKGIVVTTDDPIDPTRLLTLRADVVSSIELLPDDVLYLHARGGEPPTARLLVRSADAELDVSELRTSTGWLQADAVKLDTLRPRAGGVPPGFPGDWLVTIRAAPDAPAGPVTEQVTFRTGLAGQPGARVEVQGALAPRVGLSRTRLLLPPDPPRPVTETMLVAVRPGLDPASLRVDARPPSLRVSLEPAGGRLARLRVTWPGGELGDDAGLVLRLDDASWTVPVSARVERP